MDFPRNTAHETGDRSPKSASKSLSKGNSISPPQKTSSRLSFPQLFDSVREPCSTQPISSDSLRISQRNSYFRQDHLLNAAYLDGPLTLMSASNSSTGTTSSVNSPQSATYLPNYGYPLANVSAKVAPLSNMRPLPQHLARHTLPPPPYVPTPLDATSSLYSVPKRSSPNQRSRSTHAPRSFFPAAAAAVTSTTTTTSSSTTATAAAITGFAPGANTDATDGNVAAFPSLPRNIGALTSSTSLPTHSASSLPSPPLPTPPLPVSSLSRSSASTPPQSMYSLPLPWSTAPSSSSPPTVLVPSSSPPPALPPPLPSSSSTPPQASTARWPLPSSHAVIHLIAHTPPRPNSAPHPPSISQPHTQPQLQPPPLPLPLPLPLPQPQPQHLASSLPVTLPSTRLARPSSLASSQENPQENAYTWRNPETLRNPDSPLLSPTHVSFDEGRPRRLLPPPVYRAPGIPPNPENSFSQTSSLAHRQRACRTRVKWCMLVTALLALALVCVFPLLNTPHTRAAPQWLAAAEDWGRTHVPWTTTGAVAGAGAGPSGASTGPTTGVSVDVSADERQARLHEESEEREVKERGVRRQKEIEMWTELLALERCVEVPLDSISHSDTWTGRDLGGEQYGNGRVAAEDGGVGPHGHARGGDGWCTSEQGVDIEDSVVVLRARDDNRCVQIDSATTKCTKPTRNFDSFARSCVAKKNLVLGSLHSGVGPLSLRWAAMEAQTLCSGRQLSQSLWRETNQHGDMLGDGHGYEYGSGFGWGHGGVAVAVPEIEAETEVEVEVGVDVATEATHTLLSFPSPSTSSTPSAPLPSVSSTSPTSTSTSSSALAHAPLPPLARLSPWVATSMLHSAVSPLALRTHTLASATDSPPHSTSSSTSTSTSAPLLHPPPPTSGPLHTPPLSLSTATPASRSGGFCTNVRVSTVDVVLMSAPDGTQVNSSAGSQDDVGHVQGDAPQTGTGTPTASRATTTASDTITTTTVTTTASPAAVITDTYVASGFTTTTTTTPAPAAGPWLWGEDAEEEEAEVVKVAEKQGSTSMRVIDDTAMHKVHGHDSAMNHQRSTQRLGNHGAGDAAGARGSGGGSSSHYRGVGGVGLGIDGGDMVMDSEGRTCATDTVMVNGCCPVFSHIPRKNSEQGPVLAETESTAQMGTQAKTEMKADVHAKAEVDMDVDVNGASKLELDMSSVVSGGCWWWGCCRSEQACMAACMRGGNDVWLSMRDDLHDHAAGDEHTGIYRHADVQAHADPRAPVAQGTAGGVADVINSRVGADVGGQASTQRVDRVPPTQVLFAMQSEKPNRGQNSGFLFQDGPVSWLNSFLQSVAHAHTVASNDPQAGNTTPVSASATVSTSVPTPSVSSSSISLLYRALRAIEAHTTTTTTTVPADVHATAPSPAASSSSASPLSASALSVAPLPARPLATVHDHGSHVTVAVAAFGTATSLPPSSDSGGADGSGGGTSAAAPRAATDPLPVPPPASIPSTSSPALLPFLSLWPLPSRAQAHALGWTDRWLRVRAGDAGSDSPGGSRDSVKDYHRDRGCGIGSSGVGGSSGNGGNDKDAVVVARSGYLWFDQFSGKTYREYIISQAPVTSSGIWNSSPKEISKRAFPDGSLVILVQWAMDADAHPVPPIANAPSSPTSSPPSSASTATSSSPYHIPTYTNRLVHRDARAHTPAVHTDTTAAAAAATTTTLSPPGATASTTTAPPASLAPSHLAALSRLHQCRHTCSHTRAALLAGSAFAPAQSHCLLPPTLALAAGVRAREALQLVRDARGAGRRVEVAHGAGDGQRQRQSSHKDGIGGAATSAAASTSPASASASLSSSSTPAWLRIVRGAPGHSCAETCAHLRPDRETDPDAHTHAHTDRQTDTVSGASFFPFTSASSPLAELSTLTPSSIQSHAGRHLSRVYFPEISQISRKTPFSCARYGAEGRFCQVSVLWGVVAEMQRIQRPSDTTQRPDDTRQHPDGTTRRTGDIRRRTGDATQRLQDVIQHGGAAPGSAGGSTVIDNSPIVTTVTAATATSTSASTSTSTSTSAPTSAATATSSLWALLTNEFATLTTTSPSASASSPASPFLSVSFLPALRPSPPLARSLAHLLFAPTSALAATTHTPHTGATSAESSELSAGPASASVLRPVPMAPSMPGVTLASSEVPSRAVSSSTSSPILPSSSSSSSSSPSVSSPLASLSSLLASHSPSAHPSLPPSHSTHSTRSTQPPFPDILNTHPLSSLYSLSSDAFTPPLSSPALLFPSDPAALASLAATAISALSAPSPYTCAEPALSLANTCALLRAHFPCRACIAAPGHHHPSLITHSGDAHWGADAPPLTQQPEQRGACHVNAQQQWDCHARQRSAARLCACVRHDAYYQLD